jgi:hypothetical protein
MPAQPLLKYARCPLEAEEKPKAEIPIQIPTATQVKQPLSIVSNPKPQPILPDENASCVDPQQLTREQHKNFHLQP